MLKHLDAVAKENVLHLRCPICEILFGRKYQTLAILAIRMLRKLDSSEGVRMLIDELIDLALAKGGNEHVLDVRAGLGYTCVRLEQGCGLAYTFRHELGGCCSVLGEAGSLISREAADLIPWIKSQNRLKAAIGLATINAVLNDAGADWDKGNVFKAFSLTENDTFGMVGDFVPLLKQIKKMTNNIYVFEQEVEEGSGLYSSEDIPLYLPRCDVVVITATSLINHTLEDILPHCQNAREVCLVGASTPLSPEIFEKYNVSLLAGSVVTDPDLALQIVSQGGGTGALKPAMDHVLQRI